MPNSMGRGIARRKAATTVMLLVAVSIGLASRGAAAMSDHRPPPCNSYDCGPGRRPVAPNQKFTTPAHQTSDEVLGAYDPEGTITEWILLGEDFSAHTNGFVWRGDGTFAITPVHSGRLHFQYRVRDNHGRSSNVGTVTLIVKSTPPPPPTTTTTIPPTNGYQALCSATEAAFGPRAGGALCDLINQAARADAHHETALKELLLRSYIAIVRVSQVLRIISSQQASSLIGQAQAL